MKPLNKLELKVFIDTLTYDLFDSLVSEFIPYSLENKAFKEIRRSIKDTIDFEGVTICDPTEN